MVVVELAVLITPPGISVACTGAIATPGDTTATPGVTTAPVPDVTTCPFEERTVVVVEVCAMAAGTTKAASAAMARPAGIFFIGNSFCVVGTGPTAQEFH